MVTEYFANPNLSVAVAKFWFLGFVMLDRTVMCSVFTITLTKVTRFLQEDAQEDVLASFLFVGDLNGHHQEWLGSTTTNHHGVAAIDFTTASGCDHLVVGGTWRNN